MAANDRIASSRSCSEPWPATSASARDAAAAPAANAAAALL